jgi:hypothetical protein
MGTMQGGLTKTAPPQGKELTSPSTSSLGVDIGLE